MFGTRHFFFWLDRFGTFFSQAIGRAIDPGFAAVIVDPIGCIVGTGGSARVADIVSAQHACQAIYTPGIIVLRVACTIPVVQAVGEGAAYADNNG
jgi:hypothetical protein